MIEFPWFLAYALVIVPVLVGTTVGAALRRRGRGVRAAGACAVGALAVAWWLLPRLGSASSHDLLLAAGLFGAAMVAAARPRRPRPGGRERALRAVAFAAGIGALELVARVLPAVPMVVPPADEQRLLIPIDEREFGTRALFPDRYTEGWLPGFWSREAWAHPARGRRVLHLGDSMVASGDAPAGASFTDVLTRETGDDHRNLGVSNSSTDLHLEVFRRWAPRVHGDAAVLHVFAGNDPEEMDRPYAYAYCGWGPLLGDRSRGMPSRCPSPRWLLPRGALLARSPSPYPLRILATRSALARRLTYQWEVAAHGFGGPVGRLADDAPQWRRLADAVAALSAEARARGVPLTVSVLPFHAALHPEAESHRDAVRRAQRLAAACRAAGVRVIEPLPELAAAVRARPGARWFLVPSPHFDVDGHRWYADWLRAREGW